MKTKDLILQLLDGHRVMAIATNRADGWPQVTLVGYVNDGFLLYCFVARNSQKCANILLDSRVSIAIGSDTPQPCDIKGLSLAGRASVVTDHGELDHISRLRLKRYPEYAATLASTADENAAARVSPDRHRAWSRCCASNRRSSPCQATRRASATASSSPSRNASSTCM